jgi:hypothetical protein
MTNTYRATIKVGSGLTPVSIQADSLSHARVLLESMYGRGNVINLHQG